MRIFAVDDERLVLETLRRLLREAAPEAEICCFGRADEALKALSDGGEPPEAIFSDIEMPGLSGLELAVRAKTLSPDTRFVFVTGYSEYALEAYRLHVEGYILKPVTVERVREELALARRPQPLTAETPKRLAVRCFGAFEVFWDEKPLVFARAKTKELFAYLIDRRGELCTAGELIDALWEGGGELSRRKAYLRTLTADLQTVLAGIGMEAALIRQHQQWAVRQDLLDCDYYRMLAGDMEALNSFRGDYMTRYSWAELTAARLHFDTLDRSGGENL